MSRRAGPAARMTLPTGFPRARPAPRRSATVAPFSSVVQIPFLFGPDTAEVTSTHTTVFEYHPADSAAAERLWDALYLARASKSCQPVADLEDAAFRQCNSSPPS